MVTYGCQQYAVNLQPFTVDLQLSFFAECYRKNTMAWQLVSFGKPSASNSLSQLVKKLIFIL